MTPTAQAEASRRPAEEDALERLPVAWLVIGALGTLREFALPLLVAAVTRLRDGRVSGGDALVGAAILAVTAAVALLRWRSLRWGIVGESLVLRRGVLARTRRELPLARIVAVQIEEPLTWRLLGLKRLRLQTASGTGDDAVIDAAPAGRVAAITARLTTAATTAGDAPGGEARAHSAAITADALDRLGGATAPPGGTLLHRATTAELALAGVTGGALAGIGALLLVTTRLLDDAGLDERVVRAIADAAGPWVATVGRDAIVLLVAAGAIAILVIALPLAALYHIVRLGGLTVVREGDTLVRRAGLLERRERRVPADAVQGLWLTDTPLMRLARGTAFAVGTAALGDMQSGQRHETGRIDLVPFVRPGARPALAESLLPGAAVVLGAPWSRVALPAPARARAAIGVAVAVLVAVVATVVTGSRWPWLLVPVAAVVGVAHVRGRGRAAIGPVTGPWLATAWGTFVRRTAIVRAATAEVMHRRAGPLQRRAGACSLHVALADGSTVRFPDVPVATADAIERRIRTATSRVLGPAPRPAAPVPVPVPSSAPLAP